MATDGKHLPLILSLVFLLHGIATAAKGKLPDDTSLEDVYAMVNTVIGQNEAVLTANEELRTRNAELERRVETLEMELRDVGKGRTPEEGVKKRFLADFASVGTTAFSAVVSPPDLTVNAGQDIIFDKTITNVANAYNNSTGVFTAPIQGIYVFNFAVMINAGDNEYVELVADGSHVMWNYGHAQGSLHYISASRTVTLALNHGQQVWVRVYQSSHHGTGRIHGNGYSTFSGWLIAITE